MSAARALHVLHTESSCGWGGQEIRILSESTGMIARGHRVALACVPGAPIERAAAAAGLEVLPLPIGRKRLPGLRALRRLFARRRFDVVVTHSSTDAWLVALACMGRRDAPPVVRIRHVSAPVAASAPNRWLYGRSVRHVVTTGERLRRELIETLGCPAQHVTSVPTGIDAGRFAPGDRNGARAALGLPRDALLVGIVATLRSWKGHRFLIDALARLPDPRVRLVIVGDGPMSEALREQAAQTAPAGRCVFAGQQEDVLPWLHAFDVFALPSYANEGVPQALIQAMLCALPCVTTAVGAIPEIAIDARTALVVPPRDATALAAAIARLAGDPALRTTLGQAARAHCLAGYTRDAMLDRMEHLLLSVARPAADAP
ncbi:MAG: glycosyltransferase family 4 protein [Burkholderiales bacterium]|nr:glycosyltransferase family 4 protein [Burkholderiales bacterium]OJX07560.1 MAG: glycosyl transferase family 1 [Burkholderiales bacterium 70-64]